MSVLVSVPVLVVFVLTVALAFKAQLMFLIQKKISHCDDTRNLSKNGSIVPKHYRWFQQALLLVYSTSHRSSQTKQDGHCCPYSEHLRVLSIHYNIYFCVKQQQKITRWCYTLHVYYFPEGCNAV